MADYLLISVNPASTQAWIKAMLFPNDNDWIVAAHQRFSERMLSLANDRSDLAPYPQSWPDEIIYFPPNTPYKPFILLNISDAQQTDAYIRTMVGSSDNIVAVRTAATMITFADNLGAFSNWTGPTSIDVPSFSGVVSPGGNWMPYPPFSSGVVVPGGNWMPADSIYVQALAHLLDIPGNPELINYMLGTLWDKEQTDNFLTNPAGFVNTLAEKQQITLDAAVIPALEQAIQVNTDRLREVSQRYGPG